MNGLRRFRDQADLGQKSLMLVGVLAKLRPNQWRKRLAPRATLFSELVG
jgi:hypothetical protein